MKKTLTFREAIRETLFAEMEKNPEMFMMGENYRYKGSIFSQVLSPAFRETFGDKRVLETPVSENAIIGLSFGAALAGMTAVPEIYSADFLFCVGTEIVNDIPKWRIQHQYKDPIHMVIRAPMGYHAAGGGGPEHSQCPEAYFQNTPGLVIVAPSTCQDAVGLLKTALHLGDPVLFLEHRRLYDVAEEVDLDGAPIPIRSARVEREGTDLTIVAWNYMLQESRKAADELAAKGYRVELIDPRTIKPMDYAAVIASVQKTGRLLVAEETPRTGSVGSEIITRVMEACPHMAAGRFAQVTMPDVPYHYNRDVERAAVPSSAEIVKKALAIL